MAKKENNIKGLFLISVETDNLMENKDINELIVGKKELKTVDNTGVKSIKVIYKTTILRVNKCSNIKGFYDLLKEGDLNENDFRLLSLEDLKKLLYEKREKIIKIVHTNCKEIVEYIREVK